jgi:hypothetical protein
MGRVRYRRAAPLPSALWLGVASWLVIIGGGGGVSVLPPAPAAAADNGQITNITVAVKPDQLVVSARLSDDIPNGAGDEIRRGIGKTLYYYTVLKRRVPAWIDEELASSTVRYRIWYDLVKRQFVVAHRQGDRETRQTAEQFDDVRRLLSHIQGVTIPLPTPLRRDDTYYVSVKAEMRSAKLPVYIEYFLFFLPVAQLSTPWGDSAPFTAEPPRTPS